MRKSTALIVLAIAVSCLADSNKKKLDKFMPPAESHGKAISGYGCDKQNVIAETTSTSKPTSIWTLVFWAQYGDEHKRYWQKSYYTYQVPIKRTVKDSGEDVKSGGVVGGFEIDAYDFGAMDEDCNLWGTQVRTTLKVEANGVKVK